MGVLNIPQLQSSGQGQGGEMISSLAQLLLRSKLQGDQETKKNKFAQEQTDQTRKLADVLATEERTRAGSSLADVLGISKTVPTTPDPNVPAGIRRPPEQLEPSPNPKYQSLVNQPKEVSNEALKDYYGESFKAQFPKADKDKEITDIVKFETVTGTRPSLRGTPEYKKAYMEWNGQLQSVNRPRFMPYTSPDGSSTEMINVNDTVERSIAEGRGLVPGMPDKLSAGTKEDISSTKELQQVMKEINQLYYGGGAAPGQPAPGRKWVGKLDSALGNLTGQLGVGEDPNEQRFRVLVNSLMNITGKLRAGSAWTAPEIQRLEQELATTSQGENKFEQALTWAGQSAQNKLGAIGSTARDTRTYYRPQAGQQAASQGAAPAGTGQVQTRSGNKFTIIQR